MDMGGMENSKSHNSICLSFCSLCIEQRVGVIQVQKCVTLSLTRNFMKQNDIIDSILNSYKNDLGKYFEQYKNHVYRVYNFAVPYATLEKEIKILSIASAFHDLGIWTHNTFDYLQPSIALAKKYSEINNLNAEAITEIGIIINEHHKLSRVETSKLAEIFRQADIVDLTWGLIRNGRSKTDIKLMKNVFPNKGFHIHLTKLFMINILKHPLKPLPMYKL
jgi:HD domain